VDGGQEPTLKTILLSLLVLPLAACNPNPRVMPIGDPVAIPYQVSLKTAAAGLDGRAALVATVRYGGFGSGGPARIEFKNGTEVLATSTERVSTSDATGQEFTFSSAFNPVPKTVYQIRAVVTWTYGRTPGSIESTLVQYP